MSQDFDGNLGSTADQRITENAFDDFGRLEKVTSDEGIVNYGYDDATGQLLSTWTGDTPAAPTTQTDYTYDRLGRLETVTAAWVNGVDIPDETTSYKYDAVGNLAFVIVASSTQNIMVSEYSYDELNRLELLEHYYDANNNRLFDGSDRRLATYDYELAVDGQRTGVTEETYDELGIVPSQTNIISWSLRTDGPWASRGRHRRACHLHRRIEHLVSLGHRRIAFAACERDDGDHLDRFQAYREVLESHGLLDESLVYRVPPHRLDGAQLIRNLLGRPNRPTAIYIADPLVAVGAMNEANRLGVRIPDDLSLIGFDDTDTRSMVYPSMSAVCQDSKMLGRSALELLLKRIKGVSENGSNNDQHSAWLDLGGTSADPPTTPRRVLPVTSTLPA